MAEGRYVRVPQDDGEVTITFPGREPRTWRVDDHLVTARTVAEEAQLLRLVDGARLATTAEVTKIKGGGSTQRANANDGAQSGDTGTAATQDPPAIPPPPGGTPA